MDLQSLLAAIDQLSPEEFDTLIQHLEERKKYSYSARELMQLPREQRERLVAEAFAAAADEDFEIFEAFDEDDFDEYS